MKATGVVRRIDELGRIVIPKEIRKNLRIHEGENIEIYINEKENIVLKKHSLIKEIDDFAQKFTDSLHSFFKKDILIADTDYIVAVSGSVKRDVINTTVSDGLLNIIQSRELVVENNKKLKINEEQAYDCSYVASPIICHGDSVGIVIIFSKNDEITDFDKKLGQMTSYFLSKYLED